MGTTYQQLIRNLEYLRLSEMRLHLDEVIDASGRSGMSFAESLIKLTGYEIDRKEANAVNAMVKIAAFPHRKSKRKIKP